MNSSDFLPIDSEEIPSLLLSDISELTMNSPEDTISDVLSKVQIQDVDDEEVDDEYSPEGLMAKAVAIVQKDRMERTGRNLVAILISIMRTRMKQLNLNDPSIVKYLDHLSLYTVDPSLGPILDRYMKPTDIPSIAHLISPPAIASMITKFKTNLYLSLVGSHDMPYSENAFAKAVHWLDDVGLKYAQREALLKLKRQYRDRMMAGLIALAKECLDGDLLAQYKVYAKEKVARMKVLQAQIKLAEQEKKQQAKSSKPTSDPTASSSPSTPSYSDLVLENEALAARLKSLQQIKSRVGTLDQDAVARYRAINKEYQFALEIARKSQTSLVKGHGSSSNGGGAGGGSDGSSSQQSSHGPLSFSLDNTNG